MNFKNLDFTALDNWLEGQMAFHKTPGMAIALTDNKGTLHLGTYGYADLETRQAVTPQTLFEIGSIGKTFTAIAALQASEAGLLDLHVPITNYLPWFQVENKFVPITLHHLLTHSSGLIAGTDFTPAGRSEVWALRDTEIAVPPGDNFYYSDVGYKTIGLVLQAATGRRYPELIRKGIFDPLEMKNSVPEITHSLRPHLAKGYRHLYDDRPSHPKHPIVPAEWLETDTADGCIASNAEDMAIFARMLLNRGEGPKGRIITPTSYELMTSPLMAQDEEWSYGYGLNVFEHNGYAHIGHGGDMPGYEAYLWLDVDNQMGMAMLVTQPYPSGISTRTLEYLRATILSQPLPELSPPPDLTCLQTATPEEFAGVYNLVDNEHPFNETDQQTRPKTLLLIAEGERLLLEHDGERIRLEERGDDHFYVNHPDFDLFLLRFGRKDNTDIGSLVVEAFHGPHWYTNENYAGPAKFDVPHEWITYPGHYRAHNPWESNFRVILRKGELLLVWPSGEEETLTPLGDGTFRIGDEHSPERLRFDQFVGEVALRANRSGCDYYRFFTR